MNNQAAMGVVSIGQAEYFDYLTTDAADSSLMTMVALGHR